MDRPFVKFYVDYIHLTSKLSLVALHTLFGLLYFLEDDNTVDLSTQKRTQIARLLRISQTKISKGIKKLKEEEIITKLGKGYYKIDSMILSKNEANDY